MRWPRFIPPVGDPIGPRLRGRSSDFDWTFGGRYRPIFVDSGTTALRLAISAARLVTGRDGPSWVPAYGCPDILSACLAAGAEPMLYEVQEDRPFFQAGQLPPANLTSAIAAHFVGYPHPPDDLKVAVSGTGAVLIEDSAQRFPSADTRLFGDCVVLSFGRGKPLSLMEGGCLLANDRLYPHALAAAGQYGPRDAGIRGTVRRRLHDLALRPEAFALVRRLPGLAIGRVEFRRAPAPMRAGPRLEELATRAAAAYQAETDWASRQLSTEAYIARDFPGLQMPFRAGNASGPRLSRIPCLAVDGPSADKVFAAATRAGIRYSHVWPRASRDRGSPDPAGWNMDERGDARGAAGYVSIAVTCRRRGART